MPIRSLKGGGYQADYQDKARGIARTKRTFRGKGAKRRAEEWIEACRSQAHDRLLNRKRYLFGEALADYLQNITPQKRTAKQDLVNANTLRWPVRINNHWGLLEEAPIDDSEDGIIAMLHRWTAQMRQVQRRAYHGNNIYHQINGNWYQQPDPAEGDKPKPRCEVTDQETIKQIESGNPKGPYAENTLRIRQVLVASVIRHAYKNLRWIQNDFTGLINYAGPSRKIEQHLNKEQMLALLIAAPPNLDEAILAAALIGWRRSNIIGASDDETTGLQWEHIQWPIYQNGELIMPGTITAPRYTTKNTDPITVPMSELVHQLLQHRWDCRSPNSTQVFHQGNGRRFGDIRKTWKRIKREAGVPADLRWHDLRHTFATWLLESGASEREIMELGGWKEPSMIKRYAHMKTANLKSVVDRVNDQKF